MEGWREVVGEVNSRGGGECLGRSVVGGVVGEVSSRGRGAG